MAEMECDGDILDRRDRSQARGSLGGQKGNEDVV